MGRSAETCLVDVVVVCGLELCLGRLPNVAVNISWRRFSRSSAACICLSKSRVSAATSAVAMSSCQVQTHTKQLVRTVKKMCQNLAIGVS